MNPLSWITLTAPQLDNAVAGYPRAMVDESYPLLAALAFLFLTPISPGDTLFQKPSRAFCAYGDSRSSYPLGVEIRVGVTLPGVDLQDKEVR